MKTHGGVGVQLHSFLTLAPDGGDWSASGPNGFTIRERDTDTQWIIGRLGLEAAVKRKITTRDRTPVVQPIFWLQ
jgi:hypothetical protein